MPSKFRNLTKRKRAALERQYAHPPTPLSAWITTRLLRAPTWTSPAGLARALGMDPHYIYNWIRGGAILPSSARKLAEYFNVPLAEVYAVANLPLRADWEVTTEDWRSPPDLGQPLDHVLAFIASQPWDERVKADLRHRLRASEAVDAAMVATMERHGSHLKSIYRGGTTNGQPDNKDTLAGGSARGPDATGDRRDDARDTAPGV